jgi:NADPH:quinone reductase-like Zn-dependent oxidoreductase
VRVRARSLNYRDLMVLKGGGRGPTKIGVIPLSDGAGEVAAVGEGVTRVKIGDRIAGCFHPRWFGGPIRPEYLTDRLGANLDGMPADYAVLSEKALVQVLSQLSFEEAAMLPCGGVTACVALTVQSSGQCRRYGFDAGLGRRLGLCLAIRQGLGRPSDRDEPPARRRPRGSRPWERRR